MRKIAPTITTLLIFTVFIPFFVASQSHYYHDIHSVKAGYFLPSASGKGIFSQIYFDPSQSKMTAYASCQLGDCDWLTFLLEEEQNLYRSTDRDGSLSCEVLVYATSLNDLVVLTKIIYSDAVTRRIEQRFRRKSAPDA